MNSLDSIANSILSFGGDVILNFFIYGFIGSMLGLIWSIFLIKRYSRKGGFDRPNKIWAFLVSINKVYLPIVAMIFCGMMSGIFGVNSAVNNEIENQVELALNQVDLQGINLDRLDQHLKSQLTLEEGLAMEMSKGNGMCHENAIIARAMMDEMGMPREIDQMVEKIRSVDLSVFQKGASFGISYFATDYVDGIFWMAYRYVFVLLCFLFLKLPALEFVFFFFYSKVFGKRERPSINVRPSYVG